jgi:hypothetical protein
MSSSHHLDIWELERAWEAGDRAWERFLGECERLLGLEVGSLDGNEAEDGWSLDSAHDAFKAGLTPAEYVAARRLPAAGARPHVLLGHRAGVMWLDPEPPIPPPAARPAAENSAPARPRPRLLASFLTTLAGTVAFVLALLLVQLP